MIPKRIISLFPLSLIITTGFAGTADLRTQISQDCGKSAIYRNSEALDRGKGTFCPLYSGNGPKGPFHNLIDYSRIENHYIDNQDYNETNRPFNGLLKPEKAL